MARTKYKSVAADAKTQVTNLERMLFDVMNKVETNDNSTFVSLTVESREWFTEKKKERTAEREQTRAQALAKLSEQEKIALGVA